VADQRSQGRQLAAWKEIEDWGQFSTFHLALAQSFAQSMAAFPPVEAVALSGSVRSGRSDPESDIDVYVYVTGETPVAARSQFLASRASGTRGRNSRAGHGIIMGTHIRPLTSTYCVGAIATVAGCAF
jgi:hypothetical protein